jgi:hypothetical protein
MDEILFEDLPGQQKKRVAFSIGRFSIPTVGHYKVFDKMKEFIRKNPNLNLESTLIVVIIDGEKSGQDKKTNPLTVDERIKFMESSGKANNIKFLTAKNAFLALGVIRENGYEPIAVGAGSDRAADYIRLLDKHFKSHDDTKIKHYVVPGLTRDSNAVASKKSEKEQELNKSIENLHNSGDIDDDEVSGSLARHAATLGYFEEFMTIVGLEKKPKLAKMLYDKVRKSMGVEDVK